MNHNNGQQTAEEEAVATDVAVARGFVGVLRMQWCETSSSPSRRVIRHVNGQHCGCLIGPRSTTSNDRMVMRRNVRGIRGERP